ncbi:MULTISPECIES: hypothetical protein [Mycolicibacterium]|uniref:Secreted protein n=1 Tax=Mycolicibacterium neoaurum TaxID=1795 RepID=A0AAV2WN59_MYCNE|nr:hypothetical protein [Mycolicibacterium neoaurum]QVI29668.1 hypothetical protein MN2019_10420 [Mycolicibacterium neoaurum]TLH57998.1 hypothetical protein C1S81_16090 [Mycolicibacterium neoaurum]CDQ45804.1 secreted protein [Mycolicibacterium neoaurum]SDE51620.1 hypothetical protein SAMN04488581_4216 [Mycolicibacterium neoaurum]
MLVRRLCAALAALVVAGLFPAPSAGAAAQWWNGRYQVVSYASQKNGTSVAARQPEGDLTALYTFATACGTACVATVVDGPAPSNPTIPQPQRYTWSAGKWTFSYNWQWECFRGEGLPRVYSPAQSWVTYTPQPDGSLQGSWYTDILSGPCRGNVLIPAAAFPAP